MEKLYKSLYILYFTLNNDFLISLNDYCLRESDHKKTLDTLIKEYSSQEEPTPELLNYIYELINNNSVGCMEEYHSFIDLMLLETK